MTTTIAWFSGTGNSLSVARDLATTLGDTTLAPIPRLLAAKQVSPTGERLGLVFPVYSWGMPDVVRRYVETLETSNTKYVFAVATCGGSGGATLRSLDTLLKQRGGRLDAGFYVTMPGNCTPLYGGPSPDKLPHLIARADARVAAIGAQIRANHHGVERDFMLADWLSCLLYPGFSRTVNGSDKRFKVTHACTHCGLCARVCPVGNIIMGNDRLPVWQHRCQMCLACLQFCPTEAIQYWRLTKGVRRYRHPRISAADLTGQQPPTENEAGAAR